MKKVLLILIVLVFCFLASCSSSLYSSPVLASTKAVSIPKHKVLGKVEAKDCETTIFFIPFPANYKGMYNKIFEQAKGMGGDAIIDYQISQTSISIFFFLHMSACYTVSGTAVKFAAAEGSSWDASPDSSDSVWDASPDDAKKEQESNSSVWD